MRVHVLGTGSSGNVALVEADGARILVDAGLGPRACASRLAKLGVDLFPRGVDALLVTHDHDDHAAHALPLARALSCPVWLHEGVAAPALRARLAQAVTRYAPGDAFEIGGLRVETRALPHDAPNVAVRVTGARASVAIATDLGHAPAGLAAFLAPADMVLLEANHDVASLAASPYPDRLKVRIAGDRGHLSNDQAAAVVRELVHAGGADVVLCHLSRVTNSPARALATVRRAAPSARVHALDHGAVERLLVTRRAAQLALFSI